MECLDFIFPAPRLNKSNCASKFQNKRRIMNIMPNTDELSVENQYNYPLAQFIVEFPLLDSLPKENSKVFPGRYPEYEDWNDYRTPLIAVDNIVSQLTNETTGLNGMALFNKVGEYLRTNKIHQGKTSHLLLSLFNRGYFGADSRNYLHLEQEIWDSDNGHHINPSFKKEQTELPSNLQIRKSILSALSTDKAYHEAAVTGDTTFNRECAQWYKTVLDRMSEFSEIRPAGIPLT